MNVPSPTQSLQAPQSEDDQQVRLWDDFLLAFPGLFVLFGTTKSQSKNLFFYNPESCLATIC